MQEETNSGDKPAGSNGATAPVPATAAAPARERPAMPSSRFGADRAPSTEFDSFKTMGSTSEVKLQAVTRMVNGFMGYLKDHCNRELDQLTPADMQCLSGIMASVERLEVTPKRHGYQS